MSFSIYDDIYAEKPQQPITLADAYKIVSTGTYRKQDDVKNQVARVRAAQGKTARDKEKKKLPLFTFSCELKGNRDELSELKYTQDLCVDVDNLSPERLVELHEQFEAWAYTRLLFISPSGNGLKVVVGVNSNRGQHTEVYEALLFFIRDKFGIPMKDEANPDGLDKSCKNIARACFVSYDPDIYFQEYSSDIDAAELLEIYKVELAALAPTPKKEAKKSKRKKQGVTLSNPIETIEYIVAECEAKNISLSTCHNENIRIGWALLSVDAPAEYFHRITKLNPDYEFKRMEQRYKDLRKGNREKITLGTLVYIATRAGVVMPESGLITDQQYVRNWLTSQFDFRTNEISGKVEYRAVAQDESENKSKWQTLEDFTLNEWSVDIKDIRISYSDDYGDIKTRKLVINKSDVYDLIHNHKFSPAVNPVIERFQQLHGRFSFNGTNTLSEVKKWYSAFNYGNAEYAEAFWLDWFGGVIQNLTTDGYYDKIMVLSGTGGEGKTFAIKERLCAPFGEYFTQSFNWSSNKDDLSKITKYLFILDDELNTSRKADVEQIKNITSMSRTDIREAYARFDTPRARIANFVATTNNREFLTDLTGNRRFLVLDVVTGNRDIVNSIDYSKLWAEVWQYFYIEKNVSTLDNATINKNNNDTFREISVEEEALDECFDFSNVADGGCQNANFVVSTAKEVIDFINDRTGRKFTEDARTAKKVKAILSSKGVVQGKVSRHNGKLGRWWLLKVRKQDSDVFAPSSELNFFSEN